MSTRVNINVGTSKDYTNYEEEVEKWWCQSCSGDDLGRLKRSGRILNLVSPGGAFLAAWMVHSERDYIINQVRDVSNRVN